MSIKKVAVTGVLCVLAAGFLCGQSGQDAEKIARALRERLAGALDYKGDDEERLVNEIHASLRDHVPFNPARLEVKRIKGDWKIVDGDRYIFSFGNNKREADEALKVIRFYGINRVGYVGRPNPSFTYLLCSGTTPWGSMDFRGTAPRGKYPGAEYCRPFDPDRIDIKYIRGSWKIVQGDRWLFDFGKKKAEAMATLVLIRVYGFDQSCQVVTSKPIFKYYR